MEVQKMSAKELGRLAEADEKHRSRVLKFRLKQANKTMGRQGQTIANLRGELARLREEHSKIDRGELRRLERFEILANETISGQGEHIEQLREKLGRLINGEAHA